MRLFYTDTHYAKKFGRKEGVELIDIINEDIEQGVSPHIKPGSMVTLTRNERIQRALQLWSGGAIDPYTFYVEMDMPNPSELADRLVNWQMNGIVSPEDPEQVSADKIATEPALQSIEKADQENMAIQAGENIPPTPPEYVSIEHVKMHYAFLNDKTKKLEDPDMDTLQAHADVDKATLVTLMQQQENERTTEEPAEPLAQK
jgi:hypothetical protein